MKKIAIIALNIISMMLPAALLAGEKQGVMAEYRAVEEAIRNRTRTRESRDAMLKNNIMRAMRVALERRYYDDREQRVKTLTWEALEWENPTSPNVYYVKFETFIVRFQFAKDPEFYIQSPIHEKFLVIDPALMKHEESDRTQNPAPAAGGGTTTPATGGSAAPGGGTTPAPTR